MKKSIIIAIVAALPVFAQEAQPQVAPAPQAAQVAPAAPKMDRKAFIEARKAEFMAKFDANKDGKIDDNEKKAVKEYAKAEFMNKFDANKDGKIDDEEKKAVKAAFQKRGERKGKFQGKRGDRKGKFHGKRGDRKGKFQGKRGDRKGHMFHG